MLMKKKHLRSPPPKILRLLVEHQRWLNTGGQFGEQLDQDEIQLVDMDLDGIDFSGAKLPWVCFHRSSLRGARFGGAKLRHARFISCNIEGADFSNAELQEAVFATNHEKAYFEGADLTETAWSLEEMKNKGSVQDAQRNERMAFIGGFMSKLSKGPGA